MKHTGETKGAPRITVGIPTFNRATWLRESIESVLAQSYTSFRLIVSDNASDDDTPAVARSFAADGVEYVRSERNLGAIGNIGRLVQLADTELLMILPDDDLLYPGHLKAAVDVLERFDHVGLVHSAFDAIDAHSQVIRRVNPLRSRSPVTIERHERALERLMVSSWPIGFSSVVYRTTALVDAGGLREEDEPLSDIQLWMRIALDWDFAYIAEPLAGFRVHSESATTRIGAEAGVTSNGRELDLVLAQARYQRRMNFLDDAPLKRSDKKWLTTLATLGLLVDQAGTGRPWSDAAPRAVQLAWTSPHVLRRAEPWRLLLGSRVWRLILVGRLGGRRLYAALLGALGGRRRLRRS